MRVMLKAQFDTEKANEAIRSGKLPELMKETLDHLKPESAYFGPEDGCRTCWLVLDMQDSSELPPTAEPFFTQFNAKLTFTPVMNAEDLQTGLSHIR